MAILYLGLGLEALFSSQTYVHFMRNEVAMKCMLWNCGAS